MSPPCEPAAGDQGRTLAERLDPRVVLVCVLGFVTVEAATPIREWGRFAAYAVVLLAALVVCRVPPRWLAKRLLLMVPFIVAAGVSLFLMPPARADIVRLPLVRAPVSGSVLWLLLSVAAKGTLSIGALSLPVALWDFPAVLRALEALRVPRLFVMLMAFMWRYVFLLTTEVGRMAQAREARGPQGPLLRRALVVGGMVGSLFLRSYERAERIGHAMVARGYDGSVRIISPRRRLGLRDLGLVAVLTVLLAAIRVL